MPIYHRSYRSFDGQVWRHFRWWQIVRQEWRIMLKSRLFRALGGLAILSIAVHVILVYGFDILANNPNHPVGEFLRQSDLSKVNDLFMMRFVRLQVPLVFIATLFAGSRLICNDFRFNLVDIYFSKPLSWWDYVLGKTVTLLLIGFAMIIFPAWFMLALHVSFIPTMATAREAIALAWPATLYGLAVSLPSALCVLASSSLFNGPRFASIAVFMVLMANTSFGVVIPEILEEPELQIIAFPIAINRVGEWFFGSVNPAVDVSSSQSLVYVLAVCVAALVVVCMKVRRAGAAS